MIYEVINIRLGFTQECRKCDKVQWRKATKHGVMSAVCWIYSPKKMQSFADTLWWYYFLRKYKDKWWINETHKQYSNILINIV